MSLLPDSEMIRVGLRCLCPRCQSANIYKTRFGTTVQDECSNCGLNLSENDSADGPAVFLLFILGFILIPMALIVDALYPLPIWVHGVLWGGIALALTVGTIRPLKAYIIALQYKHLPWDRSDQDD